MGSRSAGPGKASFSEEQLRPSPPLSQHHSEATQQGGEEKDAGPHVCGAGGLRTGVPGMGERPASRLPQTSTAAALLNI